jgi:hypothetical protein
MEPCVADAHGGEEVTKGTSMMVKIIVSLLLAVSFSSSIGFAEDNLTISWIKTKKGATASSRSHYFSNPLPSIAFKGSNLSILDVVVLTSVTTPEGATRDVDIFLPLDMKSKIISTDILTMAVMSGAGSYNSKGKYQVKIAVYSVNKGDSGKPDRGNRISNELSYELDRDYSMVNYLGQSEPFMNRIYVQPKKD